MKSQLAQLLHQLRDRLLVAAAAIERGDDLAAADELEEAMDEARRGIEELRAA